MITMEELRKQYDILQNKASKLQNELAKIKKQQDELREQIIKVCEHEMETNDCGANRPFVIKSCKKCRFILDVP